MAIDFTHFIEPTKLGNTNNSKKYGDESFDTEDLIFLDSKKEVEHLSSDERKTSLSDYAVANGAFQRWSGETINGKKGTAWLWLRSASSCGSCDVVDTSGGLFHTIVYYTEVGVCPAFHCNLESFTSALESSGLKIRGVKDRNGIEIYHTVELGSYPQSKADKKTKEKLIKKYDKSELKSAGFCTGYLRKDGHLEKHEKFYYNDEIYVRVIVSNAEKGNYYADGSKVGDTGTYEWFKYEPIVWKIRNWHDLPEEINPDGDNSAQFVDLRSEEEILVMPFYPNYSDSNCSFWQNSTVRGYLNGINVNNITQNGNPNFSAPNGGDFTQPDMGNFINEAFENFSIENYQKQQAKQKEKSHYMDFMVCKSLGLTIDEYLNKFSADERKGLEEIALADDNKLFEIISEQDVKVAELKSSLCTNVETSENCDNDMENE